MAFLYMSCFYKFISYQPRAKLKRSFLFLRVFGDKFLMVIDKILTLHSYYCRFCICVYQEQNRFLMAINLLILPIIRTVIGNFTSHTYIDMYNEFLEHISYSLYLQILRDLSIYPQITRCTKKKKKNHGLSLGCRKHCTKNHDVTE